jgi:hypothetical protein
LYQIYYPLVQLGDKYTHNDLHRNNVFLYKPYDGKRYIRMKYHRNGQIFEFGSEFIVKIIDYGRNYFKNENIDTQKLIKDYICPATECQPKCGKEQGYSTIKQQVKPNVSQDLRLANSIKSFLDRFIKYNIYSNLEFEGPYRTPEKRNPIFHENRIVSDIFNMLDSLESLEFSRNSWNKAKYNSTWTCVAEMNIYDDGRDYDFITL